jgi:hypothetical protein
VINCKKILRACALIIASLIITLTNGCSKNDNTRDLGTIELPAIGAKYLDLGERKEGYIQASAVTNEDFQLSMTVTVRSFGGVVDKEQTKSALLTAHSGRECVVKLGDTAFKFIPVLKGE